MRRFGPPALAAILLLLLVPVRALRAQAGTGSFAGTVTDSAGDRPVADAHIQVLGTQRAAVSGPDGSFTIPGLLPGRYDVRVIAIGFFSSVTGGVRIESGQVTSLTLRLRRTAVELPGVVVTAGSGAERGDQSAVSVAVMDQKELRQRNVNTLDQALPYVPGVLFNHNTLDIRGASGIAEGVGSRVLMLLDGHPLLTADGGQINFFAIPLLDVERTEVVKGAYSALYGSAALGGVVNLITAPIAGPPHTLGQAYAGAFDVPDEYKFTGHSLNYAGMQLQHSRNLGETGARLALGFESSDGYTQNGDVDRFYTRLKFNSAPGSAHPWDAFLVGGLSNSGDYFTWLSADHPYQVDSNTAVGDWTRDTQLQAGATFTPIAEQTSTLRISPTILYSGNRNFYANNTDWHKAVKTGVNAQYLLNTGSRNSITTGADAGYTIVRSSFIGQPGIADLSLFALDEWRMLPRLRGTLGLRLDYHDTDLGASETNLNPTAGLVWNATDWLNARGSLSRGYRAPSAIEQFINTVQEGFHVVPNPDLRGETGWTGELGLTASVGRASFDGALFQSNYQGFIGPQLVPPDPLDTLGAPRVRFANLSAARIRGFDVSSRMAIWPGRVELAGSYLYLDTRNGDTGDPLPYRSRHSLTGSLDVLSGLVGVDVRWRSRIEEVLVYPLDPRTDITVVDLRLAYRILGTVVMAKATNLLQAKYVDVQERTQGAPRTVQVTVMVGT
ncbi:MAG TPA: TonB-dependent receptor [Gemmatimonadales bacterium]|nr:TonB-dependent receptor [Gemmatimonadales bacterium]